MRFCPDCKNSVSPAHCVVINHGVPGRRGGLDSPQAILRNIGSPVVVGRLEISDKAAARDFSEAS